MYSLITYQRFSKWLLCVQCYTRHYKKLYPTWKTKLWTSAAYAVQPPQLDCDPFKDWLVLCYPRSILLSWDILGEVGHVLVIERSRWLDHIFLALVVSKWETTGGTLLVLGHKGNLFIGAQQQGPLYGINICWMNTSKVNKLISLLKGRWEDPQDGVTFKQEESQGYWFLCSRRDRDASLSQDLRTTFLSISNTRFDQHMEPQASGTAAILAALLKEKKDFAEWAKSYLPKRNSLALL